MIDKIISTTIKTIVTIALLFTFILAFLFAVLKFGVQFDRINIANITIEKPYIKIDKKLNFKAEQLIIKPSQKPSKKININSTIKQIFNYLLFVESIDIKTIKYNDQELSVIYNKELFKIENNDIKVITKLQWVNVGVLFDINELTYKKFNINSHGTGIIYPDKKILYLDLKYSSDLISGSINISATEKHITARIDKNNFQYFDENGTIIGTLNIDLTKNIAIFDGEADFLDIKGSLNIVSDSNKVAFKAFNGSSKSLKKLTNILPVNNTIKSWIYGNIIADYYDVKECYLEVDLINKKPLLDTMRLEVYALNTNIKFHKETPPAFGKKTAVKILNSVIDIDLIDGEFERQNANAHLTISDLFNKDKAVLTLDINSSAIFSSSIQKMLANHGLNLDILQVNGENKTDFTLQIPFSKNSINTKTDLIAKNSYLNLYGFNIHLIDLNLTTNNHNIYIPRIKSAYKFWDNSELEAKIDAKNNILSIVGNLYNFIVINKAIADAPKLNINIQGSWDKNNISLASGELQANLNITKNKISLNLLDLSKLNSYIPLMQLLDINAGKLNLNYTAKQSDANFSVTTKSPLFYSNNNPINEINGSFLVQDENISLDIFNKLVTYEQIKDSSTLLINNLEVDLFKVENFLKERKSIFAKNDNNSTSIMANKFFIFGKNSAIKYKQKKLYNDKFSVNIENGNLEAEFKEKNSTLTISKRGDEIIYKGSNIGSSWINAFFTTRMLSGSWNLTAIGNQKSGDYYGTIEIKKSKFKEARLVTNIIAIINTLPALVQFRSPGFTSDGFEIESGSIEFYYANDTLFLNAVRLYGTNTDVVAQGSIDIKRNKVDIYVGVQTIKGASNIIGNIPLFGYLLLGENRRIENVLHITGTIDKPVVKSEAAKEILLYPFGVAKRIINLPTN